MNQENTSTDYIYSRLGGDPELGDIVEMFVDEMPERVASLLDQLDKSDWESLRRTAHQLKGAAGSYGFDPVTPCAARVEAAVRDGEPEERIRAVCKELAELCSRLHCGQPVPQEQS